MAHLHCGQESHNTAHSSHTSRCAPALTLGCWQGKSDAEYNAFLAEMGVGPGPGAGGGGGGPGGDRVRPGLGSAPPGARIRPGDELPDDCKLYVAGLGPEVTDDMLRVRICCMSTAAAVPC